MAVSWFEALFGKWRNNGAPIDTPGAINAVPPLVATPNTVTGAIDLSLDSGALAAAVNAGPWTSLPLGEGARYPSTGPQTAVLADIGRLADFQGAAETDWFTVDDAITWPVGAMLFSRFEGGGRVIAGGAASIMSVPGDPSTYDSEEDHNYRAVPQQGVIALRHNGSNEWQLLRLNHALPETAVSGSVTGSSLGATQAADAFLALDATSLDLAIIAGPTGNLAVPPDAPSTIGIWYVSVTIQTTPVTTPVDAAIGFSLLLTDAAGATLADIDSGIEFVTADQQASGVAYTARLGGMVSLRSVDADDVGFGVKYLADADPICIAFVKLSAFKIGG